jgi:hypothetical protein
VILTLAIIIAEYERRAVGKTRPQVSGSPDTRVGPVGMVPA